MLVEFKDVVKTYGTGEGMQKAVDHISFSVNQGEFVVILGQSGAGKSTVLNTFDIEVIIKILKEIYPIRMNVRHHKNKRNIRETMDIIYKGVLY